MSDDDHFEPIHGLPGLLPAGERILWQGAPRWQSLARRAFHVRKLAGYFAALVGYSVVSKLFAHAPGDELMRALVVPAVLSMVALATLSALAYLSASTTVYTITNRRLVMRTGIAFSVAVNLPFSLLDTVGLKVYGDGTGDLPLTVSPGQRAGYFVCWPNVRPWHFTNPQPMLRAITEPARVGELLAKAMAEAPAGAAATVAPGEAERSTPREPVAA